MKTAFKETRPVQAFFSKVDDVKIKRNVSLFFLHCPFLALPLCIILLYFTLFYFYLIAWSDLEAFRNREIKVHMSDLVVVLTRFS